MIFEKKKSSFAHWSMEMYMNKPSVTSWVQKVVYSGSSASGTPLQSFSGSRASSVTVAGNSATIVLASDGSVEAGGFEALVAATGGSTPEDRGSEVAT